jgi:two-component system response regulator
MYKGDKAVKKKVVLLVEDNPDDEALTLRAFRKNGMTNEVVVARDGTEALDYIFATGPYVERPYGKTPELILLDLNLPKVDGLRVLRRLRADERTKHLPVIILSSSDEERDILESYEQGANSYIRKPVNFKEFSKAIHHLGQYWLAWNIAPPLKACP